MTLHDKAVEAMERKCENLSAAASALLEDLLLDPPEAIPTGRALKELRRKGAVRVFEDGDYNKQLEVISLPVIQDGCRKCRFWLRRHASSSGDCRRNPPATLSQNKWPKTSMDDWCGEFQPKQEGE